MLQDIDNEIHVYLHNFDGEMSVVVLCDTDTCLCDNDTYLYVCTHIATCMCDTDAYLYVCTQIATCMCVHR